MLEFVPKIVTTPAQAFANITRFEKEVHDSPALQTRLSYARAWYAYQDEIGKWHFGPSKFIGYDNIDAETYLKTAEESDGRRTEAQLKSWFGVVGPGSERYEELSKALVAFVAQYGKTPSTKMRINIPTARRRGLLPEASSNDSHDAVVSLMVAVAKTLPDKDFKNLRDQLEDISS